MINMADERFEFISVIFRLAGRPEYGAEGYGALTTDYQKDTAATFAKYVSHPAVQYAKKLPIGFDAVFNFSVHIEKIAGKFELVNDLSALDKRWTKRSAKKFLKLFNDFYTDTNYAAFYNSYSELFERVSQQFYDEEYSLFDFKWFARYINPDSLKCICSFSSGCCYGATARGNIYSLVMPVEDTCTVHEYCHSFANPIAEKWYKQNPEFKKWCKEYDAKKLPFYRAGLTMGYESVTRSFEALYYAEHGSDLEERLSAELSRGFKYIREIYEMVLEYENERKQKGAA